MRDSAVVEVADLRKTYRVMQHTPGLRGILRDLVARTYRDVEAVRGISFTIRQGELVGFIGPKGPREACEKPPRSSITGT